MNETEIAIMSGLAGLREEGVRVVAVEVTKLEELYSENARMRAALDEIAFAPPGACGPDLKGCIRIAREALEMKP
jgi:hypothetical protein